MNEDLQRRRKELEAALGLGRIDFERKIPGLAARPGDEVRYVAYDQSENPLDVIERVLHAIEPSLPEHGGWLTENCDLTLPSGELFSAVSYGGDLEGWRKQVEQGAKLLGRKTAQIVGDKLQIDDGREVNVSDCKVRFF